MYELSTLENGLRIASVAMPHGYSISTGIYLAVGSRYESEAEAGSSHFIEHMLFKGTERRRTPREIALAVEGVGGDLNASTSREVTTFYSRVSRDDLTIALDVLVDMLRWSRFEGGDVERERQIILEEIAESFDLPDDLVMMNFLAMLWPRHPLGRDVAGSSESVTALSRDTLLRYRAAHYAPQRTVISVAGPLTHGQVCEVLIPLLGDWAGGNGGVALAAPLAAGPQAQAAHRPIEQCHLLLGGRGLHRHDPDRYALGLMDVVLGEGMSSRLFNEIREERGLAYSVYTHAMQLSDSGAYAVYAAVDPDNLDETIEAVLGQFRRLRDEPLSADELATAKAYMRGRTLLRLEDSGARASWVGSQLILLNRVLTPDEALARMEAVTSEDVQRVAQRLFRDEALILSVVGPVEEGAEWTTLLHVE